MSEALVEAAAGDVATEIRASKIPALGWPFVHALCNGEGGTDADAWRREYGGTLYTGPLTAVFGEANPLWSGKQGPAGISHALGAGQFEPETWDYVAGVTGLHDLLPQSQLTNTWALMCLVYGPHLEDDLTTGQYPAVATKLTSTWTSLGATAKFAARYATAVKVIGKLPPPPPPPIDPPLPAPIPAAFHGAATPLAATDLTDVAAAVAVDPRVIWAVAQAASLRRGFLPDGRPEILYYGHQFHKRTAGQWDKSHPAVSWPTEPASYSTDSAHQYKFLSEAVTLNADAALASCSWGMFQILGANFAEAGFVDVPQFVAAMCESERMQLVAFIAFCSSKGLLGSLQAKPPDWAEFAKGYYGPAAAGQAATKLATAYAQNNPLPGTPPPVATSLTLRLGTSVSFPIRGTDQDGHPTPVPSDALTSSDQKVCTVSIDGDTATIVTVGLGKATVQGADLIINVTVEAPQIAHLIADLAHAVISKIRSSSSFTARTSLATLALLMALAAPVGDLPSSQRTPDLVRVEQSAQATSSAPLPETLRDKQIPDLDHSTFTFAVIPRGNKLIAVTRER